MERIVKRVGQHYLSVLTGVTWNASYEEPGVKIIGITSGLARSGVSTIAAHTALTAAINARAKTLLIDANFSHPSIHKVFERQPAPGLSNLLRDSDLMANSIQPTALDQLSIMPAGDDQTAWQEFGMAIGNVLKSVAEDYQLVLVDMPALSVSSSCLAWAAALDAALLVVTCGGESADKVRSTAGALKSAGVQQLGVVLNRIKKDPLDRFYGK